MSDLLNAQALVQLHRGAAVNGGMNLPATPMTLAAALEHVVWRSAHPAARDGYDAQDALWRTLQASRWPSVGARESSGDTLGALILPPQADLVLLRHVEASLRSRMTATGFTPITAKAFTGATTEIVTNIWQHAQVDTSGILAYHLEPGRVTIAIADLGIGVLNSLRTNPAYEALKTSMAALKKAMQVGVSRFPDGSGYGFDTILRAVADQWGHVRLRTGQAILEFHSSSDVRHATTAYGVELPGLQVAFTCSATPVMAQQL